VDRLFNQSLYQALRSASIIVIALVVLHPPFVALRLLVPFAPPLLFRLPLISLPMFPSLLFHFLILLRLHPLLIPLSSVYGTSADLDPPESKRSGKGYNDKDEDDK